MRRRFAIALMLVFAGSLTALFAGPAVAAPPPVVIGSCATSVQGVPGQPVALQPSAVLGVVVDAVRAVPLLGPPLAGSAQTAFQALPPIPIGVLPTGTGYLNGGVVATAVVAKLAEIPLLGAVIGPVATSVQGTLTTVCGVTMTGVNTAAAPAQEGAKSVADASQQATGALVPGGTPLPGNKPGPAPGGGAGSQSPPPAGANQPVLGGAYGGADLSRYLWGGRAPMTDYGSIPFASAGLFAPSPGVRYGGAVSGYTPQFGILGADAQDGVRVAGNAEALHPTGGGRVALPVLLAVFALSGVTAALVRTWVLRRTPAG